MTWVMNIRSSSSNATVVKLKKRHKVKITVMKRFHPSEVLDPMPVTPILEPIKGETGFEKCEHFEDRQEFIVDELVNMPEGFCTDAWNVIYSAVRFAALGGDVLWMSDPRIDIVNCIDGLRPVIFMVERLDKE